MNSVMMVQKNKTKFVTWIEQHVPIVKWLPKYNWGEDFKFDLIAGITVSMMIIPQEVSLASIMGVPAIHGLYTAAIVPMVYPLFGTSKVLSVANAAEVSLLVGAALESIENEQERVATGIFISFYSGMLMLVMGVLHLGFVVDFFSRPVMGGFVSAGGVLIMLSQVKHALGYDSSFKSNESGVITLYEIGKNASNIQYVTLALSLVSIALLFFLRYATKHWIPSSSLHDVFGDTETQVEQTYVEVITPKDVATTMAEKKDVTWSFSLSDKDYISLEKKRHARDQYVNELDTIVENAVEMGHQTARVAKSKKHIYLVFAARLLCDLGALLVCLLGIAAGYVLEEWFDHHLNLTGHVPNGFPPIVLPWSEFGNLIPTENFSRISFNSCVITLVAFMSSIAMSKRLAIRDGYEVNPNQELLGIGIGSLVGSFFQGMPSTGAMSRTAVNAQNAKTQLASIITACMVILTLLFFTEPLLYLPKATLAAIIIVAAMSLIEVQEARWLFKVKRTEFWVWLASFLLTIILGVFLGLIASIGSSLVAIIWRTKKLPLVRLGKSENGSFVDISLFEDAKVLNNVEVVRIEGSLYFANCEHVQKQIEELVERKQNLLDGDAMVKGVIIDACSINDWDATAIHVMKELSKKLGSRNCLLVMANVRKSLRLALDTSGFLKESGQHSVNLSIEQAVQSVLNQH